MLLLSLLRTYYPDWQTNQCYSKVFAAVQFGNWTRASEGGGKRSNLCALPTPLKLIISLLIWFWYERECLYFLYEMLKAAPTQSEIILLNHAALESEYHTSWNLAATSAKWEMTYRIYLLIGRPISSKIKTWICHKNFEQRDSAYSQEFNNFFFSIGCQNQRKCHANSVICM